MYKTNTHCSSGLTKPSIIILPLDVTSTMYVSEKLIWCLEGESHFKICLRAEPSCRPCRGIFDVFCPCSASLKLDLREDFKGSAFLSFPRLFQERASASFWETAAPGPKLEELHRRRGWETGEGAGGRRGWRRGGGKGKGGGEGKRRGLKEEEVYLHMHKAPSTALFLPQLLRREQRREGMGRARMRGGGAARAATKAENRRGYLHGAWWLAGDQGSDSRHPNG